MALTAVLEIGDNGIKRYQKQYMLSDFRIVFNRSYNVLPTSMARCERIEMVIVAPGKKDLEMFALFLHSDSIDGRIVIGLTDEVNDNDAKMQVLYFEGAKFFGGNGAIPKLFGIGARVGVANFGDNILDIGGYNWYGGINLIAKLIKLHF